MLRTSLLSSSLQTCMGSNVDAQRSRLTRSLCEYGDPAPHVRIEHLQEPLSLRYRYIEDPLHIDHGDRLYRCAQVLANDVLEESMLDASARQRTGVFVGSSSFSVGQEESRLKNGSGGESAIVLGTVGNGKISRYIKRAFELGGPDFSYSTACTSSANALLAAHQMMLRGYIDHALVLGLELYNETTLLGFHNLGLLANEALLPFDDRRDGLVLGEAFAAAVLSREAQQNHLQLCGGAIRTDNEHLTSPNVDGTSTASAMEAALGNTQTNRQDIVAIKTHGTGSPMSDEAEARGLRRVFDTLPPLVALKSAIGHTLGASGIAELILWDECLREGVLPANTGIAVGNTQSGVSLNQEPKAVASGYYLLNYFAFGGNNTVLVGYRD